MSDQTRLKIKIPKSAWNAYDPQPQPPRRVMRATTRATSKPTPSLPFSDNRGSSKNKDLSEPPKSPVNTISRPKGCKIKLWTFHHGGPKRVIKGASQNEVTYETPCLQPTCPNCWKWHPHLMRKRKLSDACLNEVIPEEPSTNAHSVRPALEPLSPEIDPRIVDGTWQSYQRCRSSTLSITTNSTTLTPILTPVKLSFSSDREHHLDPLGVSSSSPSAQLHDIHLPTPVVSQTVTTAQAHTQWRSVPRKHYTARLAFASHEGKWKFRALIRKRDRKVKKQEYDRAYRARKLGKGKGMVGRVSGLNVQP